MKKMSVLLMSLALVGTMLTGCGQKDSNTQAGVTEAAEDKKTEEQKVETNTKPVELTLWHETEEGISKILEEQLKNLEPEVKVNIVRKDNMTEALKLAAGDQSSSPDLIWYAHDKIGLFAEMGIIDPVENYIDDSVFEKFLPLTSEAGTYNGKHYQVPAYYETLMFMYNKDLLDHAPETTDELLQIAKDMKTDENYGFVEQHSTGYYISSWVHAFDAQIIDKEGNPGLNTDAMKKAIDYHKQFVEYMPLDGEWNTVTTLFLEGKAASIVNGPWFVASARDAGINLGVAPLPIVNETGKALTPYSGVQGMMVSSTCKDKEAAKKVLELLCKKDLGEALALKNGAAPAHKEAYDNADIQKDEIIMTLKECAQQAVPMPNIPQMDVMWSCTENALAVIYKNGADTSEALNAAQEEALKQIEAMA